MSFDTTNAIIKNKNAIGIIQRYKIEYFIFYLFLFVIKYHNKTGINLTKCLWAFIIFLINDFVIIFYWSIILLIHYIVKIAYNLKVK